jgi:hypothetical protein
VSAACSVDATCSWMCLQLVYEYEQRGAVAVEDQPPAPQRQHQRHSPTPDHQAELPARRPREITASSAAVVQRALEHGNLQDVPRSILSLFRRLDVGLGCTDKLPRQASKAPGLAADVAARVRRVSHGTTGCIAGTRQRAHRRRRPDRRTGGGPGRRRPARSAGSPCGSLPQQGDVCDDQVVEIRRRQRSASTVQLRCFTFSHRLVAPPAYALASSVGHVSLVPARDHLLPRLQAVRRLAGALGRPTRCRRRCPPSRARSSIRSVERSGVLMNPG